MIMLTMHLSDLVQAITEMRKADDIHKFLLNIFLKLTTFPRTY